MGYGLSISSAEVRLWLGLLIAVAALWVLVRPGTSWADLIPETWAKPVAFALLIFAAGVGLSGEFG